jgi:hypothetical protein
VKYSNACKPKPCLNSLFIFLYYKHKEREKDRVIE